MAELRWKVVTDRGTTTGTAEWNAGEPLRLHPDLPKGIFRQVTAELDWPMEDGERLFMNGYQTWTYSPELGKTDRLRGVDQIPKFLTKKYAFDRYGDYHFVSYGKEPGTSHGFSYCTFRKGDQYKLLASLDDRPGYTIFRYSAQKALLTLERDCAGIRHRGGPYAIFDLFRAEGTEDAVYDGWFDAMGVKPRTKEKLAGYSSWYNHYQNITNLGVEADFKACREYLRPGDLFQIDDGWEWKVGDWLKFHPYKFPLGIYRFADMAHTYGLKAGLWLAPFICETDSDLYRDHPDWLLRHEGKPWRCGANWSGFYALDIDHPGVQDYLKRVFEDVFSMYGNDYDLVKLDFLYAAAPFGTDRETRAGRMYRAMEMLRKWCGDKRILACGVPVMPAFGVADYCRVNCDVSLDWDDAFYMRPMHRERVSTRQALNNTILRAPLNGRAYGSDPDVCFLRTENCRLTEEQKKALATVNALCGQVFLTSDGKLTEAQKKTYAHYRDLFDRGILEECTVNGITYSLDGKRVHIDLKL